LTKKEKVARRFFSVMLTNTTNGWSSSTSAAACNCLGPPNRQKTTVHKKTESLHRIKMHKLAEIDDLEEELVERKDSHRIFASE
jgi:hypothetical protein